MAKVTIVGDALVITSTIKLEDYKKVKANRPEALKLKDDDGNTFFAVGVSEGIGAINEWSIEFSGETHDEHKYATLTCNIDGGGTVEEIKNDVAEDIGVALINLAKIEEMIPGVLAEIKAERDKVLECISVL